MEGRVVPHTLNNLALVTVTHIQISSITLSILLYKNLKVPTGRLNDSNLKPFIFAFQFVFFNSRIIAF